MATTNPVPVTITPAAAAHVEQLGLGGYLDKMLEQLRQSFYGLHAIELGYDEMAELRGEAEMCFTIYRKFPPGVERDRTHWNWFEWMVRNIPPEAGSHFTIMTIYEESHAG
jgi:hypothetical protein